MHSLLIAACCMIGGHVHTPSGAAIAEANLVFQREGGQAVRATSDSKGDFSVAAPPGRYDLSVEARGFATATVDTGDLVADSTIDVVLEPVDSPKLRTIGVVTVNGGFSLDRNVIPDTDVTRQQMDALGYQQVVAGLAQVPSVVIQHPDAGSPTAPAVVSLRGPDPSEALVMLDGQTLNDGNTGDLDLSQFGVSSFNSVNVTEGLGPADSVGSNTFGGAINFVSLQPTRQDHFSLSGSLGSYDSSQLWLNATGTVGKLGYALAGNNFQQGGQVNQWSPVFSPNGGPAVLTHLGSTISARTGLVNLDYNFSQRADAGVRIFTLGDERDESSASNGIDPTTGEFVGSGNAVFGQSVRAYDAYSRSVLGSGSLLTDFYASDNNVSLTGGLAGDSPYDVSHLDKRYNEGMSWGRSFDSSEFSVGGYLRQESLSGQGIDGTLSQSISSYFIRGAQQFGSNLRLSAGVYDANYTSFGNSVDWRLGASYDVGATGVLRASVGTGFRAPLLIERYYFPEVAGAPNPGLPPPDANCVIAGQGNPNEKAEHATEYELGFSKLFSPQSNLDISIYRSNLRDTIENYYPFNTAPGTNGSFCIPPAAKGTTGYAYEIPINIGNAVYEGAEVRFKQQFPKQHLYMLLSYGLNVAYPFALGPNVSNPTSGGSLVGYEQFLGVPQQQGSASLMWTENGWHAATAATFSGRNNPLAQAPYTFVDAAVGKAFGHVDYTISATNVFNSVAGRFTLLNDGVPYRGIVGGTYENPVLGDLPTNRLFVQAAAIHFTVTVHE